MCKYYKSKELYFSPIEKNDPYSDRIFLLGKLVNKLNTWELHIHDDFPTVLINEELRVRNEKFKNLPTISEIRNRTNFSNLSLISVGVFLWVKTGSEEKMICIKRSSDAQIDPSHFTGPAGRCDGPILKCIESELNEEVLIIFNNKITKKKEALALVYDLKNIDYIAELKSKQVKEKSPESLLKYIKISELKTSLIKSSNLKIFVNNTLHEELSNLFIYFDQKNNTLEIREIITLKLEDDCEKIETVNPEKYNAETHLISLENLRKNKLVETLRNYLTSM